LRRICSSKDFRTTETLVNQSVRIESTNGSGHVNGGFRRPVDGYQAAMRIAVIAHRGKNLGGGLAELRRLLADEGYDAPPWYEVPKSRKAPLGRLAYVWTGMRKVGDQAVPVEVRVDGNDWFDGRATCVLLGNVGKITGGVPAFPDARPDDGRLDVGVSTAQGALQWARTLGRMVTGQARRSPFVHTTRAAKVEVRLGAALPYELDGGARDETTRLTAKAVPQAITV